MTDPGASRSTSPFPAPVYRKAVLEAVFADAQAALLPSMIQIDLAHVAMLARTKILSRECAASCSRAILALSVQALAKAEYDGSVEDLFFLVERTLSEAVGEDNAGRIHTARSRNDLDMAMYRMVLRERLLSTLENSLSLRSVLLELAQEHRDAIMPAYTHQQPAQPTTLGHFLMAYVEVLERDAERLRACYLRVNRSPLGACAITTTGFPIDRMYTAELLGFRGLVVNSYGAIASVDYLAEACSVLATAMLSLGRFAQEMLLWSTSEFGYIHLSAGYVQISSIMPQKRNPVALEHVRILASRAMTEAQAVLGSLHNTPFADMNDAEDSLQPLVALAFQDGERALSLLTGVLTEATFNVEKMRQRAGESFLTVTELADVLVRDAGLSFHHAHQIVSAAVRAAKDDDSANLASDVHARLAVEGHALPLKHLVEALDPEHFVAIRTIVGGPAKAALQPELDRARLQQNEDRTYIASERDHLRSADELLLETATALAGEYR